MMKIDPEKIPDAPRSDVAYAGVALISRYGKAHEMETMMAAIDWMLDRDPAAVEPLVELSCDSKACACYSAAACRDHGPCSPAEAQTLTDLLDQAFRAVVGGHNGIYLEAHEAGQLRTPIRGGTNDQRRR